MSGEPERWSGRPRVPPSLQDALAVPVQARSRAVVDSGDLAAGDWACAAEWPEVLALRDAYAPGTRLGAYSRDSGVRSLVGLFADGFKPNELLALAPTLTTSNWWLRERRGLTALTPEVLRRAQQAPRDGIAVARRADPLDGWSTG